MDKLREKIAIHTLKFLSNKSYENLSLEKIYKTSKINKKTFYQIILNKRELLKNINIYFDSLILLKSNTIDNSTKRDMIFEIIMIRFDILNNHRVAIIKIYNFLKKNPQDLTSLIPSFVFSMKNMCKIAKIKDDHLLGNLKTNGLLILYFLTFLVWIKDESESLDKTMNALDKYLDRADNLIKIINK